MLAPDYYFDSVHAVPYNELLKDGIRAIIFDLDNTLAPHDVAAPDAKVVALMRRLKRAGFALCLLTNNTEKRVKTYNEKLELPTVHGALKPLTSGINRAMGLMGSKRDETAIIGDQLFSDVWGGKNARIKTVLVKQVSKKDIITVRWKRYPEKLFIKRYLKKRANAER